MLQSAKVLVAMRSLLICLLGSDRCSILLRPTPFPIFCAS
jgi:hypothetical protein